MAQIDKTDAAERLILSAIGLVERGDDPLAAHLLATSALNVLRGLIEQGDREYVGEVVKKGMFWMAEARAAGKPIDMDVPDWLEPQLVELAEAIGAGEVKGADELAFNHDKPWELLKYLMDPSNFLKHADRDPMATLDDADVDPDGAIGHALTAFNLCRPDRPLPDAIAAYLKKHELL